MFKIPVNNQKDMASIIESIIEGFGQNPECPFTDILNDFQQKNTPKQAAEAPKISKMFNVLLDTIGKSDSCCEYQYELTETADNIVLNIDIPGVQKESIVISYDSNRVLNVECDRKPVEQEASVLVKSTIEYGNKCLKLQLKNARSNATPSDIIASHNNGILTITIPKDSKTNNTNFIHVR
jgi:HSP20 family molecular chaperone IbpA